MSPETKAEALVDCLVELIEGTVARMNDSGEGTGHSRAQEAESQLIGVLTRIIADGQ